MYHISGVISCNGEDGTTNVGGSSGGSVKLTTGTLNGKGRIEVNGGKGKQKKLFLNITNKRPRGYGFKPSGLTALWSLSKTHLS